MQTTAHAVPAVSAPPLTGKDRHVQLYRDLARDLGFDVHRSCTILDFGCGAGEAVRAFRRAGYDAYGADPALESDDGCLRRMRASNGYRLPFPDGMFDFVFSEQVLEHVSDHEAALAEISRVLKPGGASLHLFPPKCRVIEAHTCVPFAGALQSPGWLRFWARLGVRNVFQQGLRWDAAARSNEAYLTHHTCYLSKRQLRALVLARFGNVTFAENRFMRYSYGRSRHLYPLVKVCPWVALLVSGLHQRVLFFRKLADGPRIAA